MKRVWLFGVIIVAVASGFALHNLLPSTLTQAQSQTEAPRRDVGQPQPAHQPVPDTRKWIAARGRLEPQSETIDIGAPSDDRLDQLLVTEGHQVEAGSALAYLESYAERLAEKNYAQSRLQDAETRLAAEKPMAKPASPKPAFASSRPRPWSDSIFGCRRRKSGNWRLTWLAHSRIWLVSRAYATKGPLHSKT